MSTIDWNNVDERKKFFCRKFITIRRKIFNNIYKNSSTPLHQFKSISVQKESSDKEKEEGKNIHQEGWKKRSVDIQEQKEAKRIKIIDEPEGIVEREEERTAREIKGSLTSRENGYDERMGRVPKGCFDSKDDLAYKRVVGSKIKQLSEDLRKACGARFGKDHASASIRSTSGGVSGDVEKVEKCKAEYLAYVDYFTHTQVDKSRYKFEVSQICDDFVGRRAMKQLNKENIVLARNKFTRCLERVRHYRQFAKKPNVYLLGEIYIMGYMFCLDGIAYLFACSNLSRDLEGPEEEKENLSMRINPGSVNVRQAPLLSNPPDTFALNRNNVSSAVRFNDRQLHLFNKIETIKQNMKKSPKLNGVVALPSFQQQVNNNNNYHDIRAMSSGTYGDVCETLGLGNETFDRVVERYRNEQKRLLDIKDLFEKVLEETRAGGEYADEMTENGKNNLSFYLEKINSMMSLIALFEKAHQQVSSEQNRTHSSLMSTPFQFNAKEIESIVAFCSKVVSDEVKSNAINDASKPLFGEEGLASFCHERLYLNWNLKRLNLNDKENQENIKENLLELFKETYRKQLTGNEEATFFATEILFRCYNEMVLSKSSMRPSKKTG